MTGNGRTILLTIKILFRSEVMPSSTWHKERLCNCYVLRRVRLSNFVRYQVLMAVSMKMAVFYTVARCSLVQVYRRFRGACCLIIRAIRPETLVNFYQNRRRNNLEDSHPFPIMYKEADCLLRCLQEPATEPCLEADQFSPHLASHFLKIHVRIRLPNCVFFPIFPLNILHVFLIFPIRATCLNRLAFVHLISLIMYIL
jgi:hypothetical protein